MPSDDDDILGGILAETQLTEAAAEAREAARGAAERAARAAERPAREPAASEGDPAARARALDSAPEPEADGIERQRRAYTADPRHNILGLIAGRRFAFVDSGEDLDGEWTVVKIEAEGGTSRLVASRDGKSPPYVKIDEDVVREELGEGRLKLI